MSIESYLEKHARQTPAKVAIVCQGGTTLTYGDLWERTVLRAESLKAEGVKPRQIHLFRASQNEDFLITYFALHVMGAIAAPLECDFPEERLTELRTLAKGAAVPEECADVLFTTGTTGQSKGVMISHATIVAEAENLIEAQGFSAETVFVICGPLNHIGSLSKVYPIMLLGATLYITEGMKNLDAFFNALEYPSNRLATFLVPASIRFLLQFASDRLARYADKIEFIETGAAPLSQSDMETFCKLLPRTRIYNTYASTETGIISTYNFNSDECIAGCLGKAMKHSEFYISEEGHVVCKGKTLMLGYLGDETATRSVLRNNSVHTADCGYIDDKGCLRLTGRSGDVINTGGYKVNPVEVENIALSFPSVEDCICTPGHHAVLGTVLKLFVVPKKNAGFSKRLLAIYLSERLERYKVPQFYEEVEKIARTYNGKLNRKFYNC